MAILVSYLRSSFIGNFAKLCQWDAALTYQLGIEKPPSKSAQVGNAAHKALELFAREKLARQQGQNEYTDPETGLTFRVGELSVERASDYGFDLYAGKAPNLKFAPKDRRDVHGMVATVLNNDFSPLSLNIVQPEQFFDFTIDEDWADYDYKDPHTGERVQGKLAVRGAVDLIFRTDSGLLAYCDYKTGSRMNWKNRTEKTVDDLHDDDQLLLYYYAIRRLYPEDRFLEMTIYYIRAGGPFTLLFDDSSYEIALKKIRKHFEDIKRTKVPVRAIDDRSIPFSKKPCTFCYFAKSNWQDGPSTICDGAYAELQEIGLDRLTAKYGKPGVWRKYSSGGGVSDRDKKGENRE